VPGVLKNAIDNVFVSFAFRNKPAAFVGYSGGAIGGAPQGRHLRLDGDVANLSTR
jgi:NAD(P)H-dependent FMN reductase